MKLQTVAPPDRGSLSVVYSCPACGYEMAMLTNAYETQVVQSLGVRIGPANALDTGRDSGLAEASATAGGKCPFPGMMPAADKTAESAIRWTSGAEARLTNIPEFVRPMAKTGIEKFARDRGAAEVDEKILDEAKEFFGM
jgi:hypothetical protein